jgi:hypothetical protein
MIALLITLITQFNSLKIPAAHVEVAEAEVEAVFVPAGHEGPIVAGPWEVEVF